MSDNEVKPLKPEEIEEIDEIYKRLADPESVYICRAIATIHQQRGDTNSHRRGVEDASDMIQRLLDGRIQNITTSSMPLNRVGEGVNILQVRLQDAGNTIIRLRQRLHAMAVQEREG